MTTAEGLRGLSREDGTLRFPQDRRCGQSKKPAGLGVNASLRLVIDVVPQF